MHKDAEVVIVGAGVAGASMALVLARRGDSVLLLEKSAVHVDRIRGESLAAWGVDEARRLGILDLLVEAGGHYASRMVPYSEGVPPEAAQARAVDLSKQVPDVAGILKIGHPPMCQALDDAAVIAGATLLPEIRDLTVRPGLSPYVSFSHDGQRYALSPRLVVGADGRRSAVARQIGAHIETDPMHHLMAGLLIERPAGWPMENMTIGVEEDRTFYIFPQSESRMRLYLCYATEQRRRFAGPDRARHFLNAFRLSSVPQSEMLAAARPLGPCQGYPNADTWVDLPIAPGVVLIGDAAGHNDPTIGQGLALAFRDVRLTSGALENNREWTQDIFIPYVEERRKRMRRLRIVAQEYSKLRCEYNDDARARRRMALKRMGADPSLALPFLAPIRGPDALPDHAYEPSAWRRLYN